MTGFGGSVVKYLPANAGDTGSNPGSVRKISWRRKWQPTPGFLPGKPMDRESWEARIGHNLVTNNNKKYHHSKYCMKN